MPVISRFYGIKKSRTILDISAVEVHCCGGIAYAVKQALDNSGNSIPCKVAIISTDGRIIWRKA